MGGGGARQAAGLPRAGRAVEEEGEGSAPSEALLRGRSQLSGAGAYNIRKKLFPSEALLRGRSQLSGAGAYITEEENYF